MLRFFILLTLFSYRLQAQERSCATMDLHYQMVQEDPNYIQKQEELEEQTTNYMELLPLMNTNSTTYVIPTVVHVLYNNSTENISDAQIMSQMNSLNADFRALNSDLSNTPSAFEPYIADTHIEFCLATVDPDGNPTTGINRVATSQSSFSSNNGMKFSSSGGVDAWNTNDYLNIWVCDLGGGLLGYAQFPGGNEATDGVVVGYTCFGSIGTAQAPYGLGRTLTHEVGHWLNLRHIWGDSYCGDDFVDDTPTQQSSNGGCPDFPSVTCGNGPNGDMHMNYMDYTYDACMYMFTEGQSNRMTAALLNYRSDLLTSEGCGVTIVYGCTNSNADNYDESANEDDGSCIISGCTSSIADNYDETANNDDGSCIVSGCTNSDAINFNESANNDDGSCIFPCDGNEITLTITTDCWGEETSWSLSSSEGTVQEVTSNTYGDQLTYNYDFCLTNNCYTFTINDSYGDGVNGSQWSSCSVDGSYQITDNESTPLVEMSDPNFGESISYEICLFSDVLGCINPNADNFNPEANTDDGSCIISGCTNSDAINFDETANNEDGSCIILGCMNAQAINYNPEANTDDGSCIILGCINENADNYNPDANTDNGSCIISGCTDQNADNYNPSANTNDNSCTYCEDFEAILSQSTQVTSAGANDGTIQATAIGGSNNYSFAVTNSSGIELNPFALSVGTYTVEVTDVSYGCTDSFSVTISQAEPPSACDYIPSGLVTDNIIDQRVRFNWDSPTISPSHYMIRYRPIGSSSWTVIKSGSVSESAYNGTSRTRYFMQAQTTYEWSIRARVLNNDLSIQCQSPWSETEQFTTLAACQNMINQNQISEANWVRFTANNPVGEWGIWQSKGRLREVSTNNYRYINGNENGLDVWKGNFDPNTDYEWHTKAWCTGNVDSEGNSDIQYHSGWGDFTSFSTQSPCDKQAINLTTSTNGAQNAVIMNWELPVSGAPDHYFLELTNETTGQLFQWNNISGQATSKTKYGQSIGHQFSWRIRGACGTNGTTWATTFSNPQYFTLGANRDYNSIQSQWNVYPNPTKGFITLSAELKKQSIIKIDVSNLIGEVLYSENIVAEKGAFTTSINLENMPKGVYLISLDNQINKINQRIILQ